MAEQDDGIAASRRAAGVQQAIDDRERKRLLIPYVARLGRRPLTRDANFGDLAVVRRLREGSNRDLEVAILLMESILSPTVRSIARQNFKLIIDGQGRVVNLRVSIRSAVFCDIPLRSALKKRMRKWTGAWQKVGAIVILKLSLVAAAAPSIQDLLENTNTLGEQGREALK